MPKNNPFHMVYFCWLLQSILNNSAEIAFFEHEHELQSLNMFNGTFNVMGSYPSSKSNSSALRHMVPLDFYSYVYFKPQNKMKMQHENIFKALVPFQTANRHGNRFKHKHRLNVTKLHEERSHLYCDLN